MQRAPSCHLLSPISRIRPPSYRLTRHFPHLFPSLPPKFTIFFETCLLSFYTFLLLSSAYDSIGRPHLTFIFGTRDHFCPLAMGTRLNEFMGRMVSPLGSRLASSWKQDSFVRWISRGFFTTLTQRVNWFPSKYRIGGRGEFRGVFCLVSIQSKLSRDSYTQDGW